MIDERVSGYNDIVTGSREAAVPADGATHVKAASAPELKSLLAIAVTALVIAALYFAQDVLIPIMLAVMLSFVLSPLVDILQRLRLWRAPAVILTVLAALGVMGLVGTLIGSQAASLTENAPLYARTIEAKVEGVQSLAVAKLAWVTKELAGGAKRRAMPAANAGPSLTPAPANAPVAMGERRPVLVEIAAPEASPFVIARTILEPILGPLETTIIVLIVAIFVLMQKEDLRDRFIRLFGSNDLHRTTLAMDDAGKRLSRYFLSQLAVNTCFGIVITLGLWAIGIPSPAMWGILAGLLRFVPYIGSFLAAVAPIALGAAVDPGWSTAIYAALLFVVVEPLLGYVVEPLLYGHSTGLSPVSVIVSAVFWTWLWGPIGLIMSTPLTLCLVVMGRHVKSLEFFDVLLGDRPALTPVEGFYQRILSHNPDEALAQAELLLADRPLLDYYDGVVVEGLKLAAGDEARGSIDHRRAAEMRHSMLSIIEDLADHNDVGGEADQAIVGAREGTVLCISGHGSFDETVSAMLVQLLARRGVGVRAVGHAAVSRERIGQYDLSGVSIVVLTYLELTGAPAHVRYLVKRLRQHAPLARIVVALWAERAIPHDDGSVKSLGADDYFGSLRETTGKILAELDREVSNIA